MAVDQNGDKNIADKIQDAIDHLTGEDANTVEEIKDEAEEREPEERIGGS